MQEYNDFTDGLSEHKARMASSIDLVGFYVHQDEKCCYTVGMSHINFPELIVFNQPLETARDIFNDIYNCVREDNLNSIEDYISSNPFSRVKNVHPFSEKTKQTIFWSARLMLNSWDFRVAQLEVSDVN